MQDDTPRTVKIAKNAKILDKMPHSPLPKNRAGGITFKATFQKIDSHAAPERDFFGLPVAVLRMFWHFRDTSSEKRKKHPKRTPDEGTHLPAQGAKALQN